MKFYKDEIPNIDENIRNVITKEDKKQIFSYDFKENRFIKINDQLYFFKKAYNHKYIYLINELMGELISKYFDLQTVHNEVIKYTNEYDRRRYGIISKNFIDNPSLCKYLSRSLFPDLKKEENIGLDNLNNLKNMIDKEKYYREISNGTYAKLLEDIKKLLVRDFISSQSDRHNCNMIFKVVKNNVCLMPVYDYEHSFMNNKFGEFFHIFDIDLKLKKVREYIRNDYTFQPLLIKAYYLNPEIIIEELENTYPVRLTQEEREAYSYIINNKQEKIKKYRLI